MTAYIKTKVILYMSEPGSCYKVIPLMLSCATSRHGGWGFKQSSVSWCFNRSSIDSKCSYYNLFSTWVMRCHTPQCATVLQLHFPPLAFNVEDHVCGDGAFCWSITCLCHLLSNKSNISYFQLLQCDVLVTVNWIHLSFGLLDGQNKSFDKSPYNCDGNVFSIFLVIALN